MTNNSIISNNQKNDQIPNSTTSNVGYSIAINNKIPIVKCKTTQFGSSEFGKFEFVCDLVLVI